MNEIILTYPGQVFVGVATRKADGTLDHKVFLLGNAVPKKGDPLLNGRVAEILTDEELLKDTARRARVSEMAAIAVLEPTT